MLQRQQNTMGAFALLHGCRVDFGWSAGCVPPYGAKRRGKRSDGRFPESFLWRKLMRKIKIMKAVIIYLLVCCLGFSGCGLNEDMESGNSEAVGSESEPTPSPPPADMSIEEYLRAPMPNQVIPEGRETVTLGTFGEVTAVSSMYKAVDAFNHAQEKYFVWIEIYYNYDRFLLDIARKQGTDLYSLYQGVSADTLVKQGILEDLTPYFESSEVVSREDIVDAVWRAGSVDDKLYFLIPCFRSSGILVEKGYTKEGAWSGRDYIDLGMKYPGHMLSDNIQDPIAQILSQLKEYMTAFIHWEDRTCSFDGDEFIALLEDLKALSAYSYEAVDEHATMAELVRGKTYLTKIVTVGMDYGMYGYRDIVEAFGDNYEIAGYPTAEGGLKYAMGYYDQIYGMNVAAENKEGAWAFLEYLVSEEYQQPMPPNYISGNATLLGSCFPARKDALERGLQANIDYVADPNEMQHYHRNEYTNENTAEGFEGFTEEDKQSILSMINMSYRSAFDNDHVLLNILTEETEAFFQGQKSAEDVAKVIQNRVSLYLAE